MAKVKKISETKALQAFQGSIRHLNQHLQLMECALKLSSESINQKTDSTIAEAFGFSVADYPQLNIPCKSKDINRTFTTSRIKINEQAIIEVYRHFSNYIKNLIEEFTLVNPIQLLESVAKNKDNKLDFERIIACGNYESIIKEMADIIYRRFENERSTPDLLNKIIKYSKISIAEPLKNRALVYLEIRHLIIHNNSCIDDKFKQTNSNEIVPLKNKNKIVINYKLATEVISSVSELCSAIDNELVSKKMVRERELIYKE